MEVEAALVKEQGVTFAVVVVKPGVLATAARRDDIAANLQPYWAGVPVVLMEQDHNGVPRYYGRRDLVRFLARVPVEALPWQKWRLH